MKKQVTREPQYMSFLDLKEERGLETIGLMASQTWYDDPKRLTFTLARYKFVAKMLAGKDHVLEIGCADGFGTRIVRQEVAAVTAIDFDPIFIEDAKTRNTARWHIDFKVHDMVSSSMAEKYSAAYALDVLEHIPPEDEDVFIHNIVKSVSENGVVILGIPSLESQEYASDISKAGHVNCKSMPAFKRKMEQYFHNVFNFSMNDEVVHTGFHKMAHYLIVVCCGKRQ